MKARDIMSSPVVTATRATTVRDLAKMMMTWRISAVPIVDGDTVVGLVSEGDLLRRAEIGTETKRSWWLQLLIGPGGLAEDFVEAHARKAEDIMSEPVVTASPTARVSEIAALMEKKHIKRVPIVSNGALGGIISRANLVQALATSKGQLDIPLSDIEIRRKILDALRGQPWAAACLVNVTVKDGIVDLWGMTPTESEQNAIRIAAESLNGVKAVNDHLVKAPVLPWI
jgi:CBS domain-containing protein